MAVPRCPYQSDSSPCMSHREASFMLAYVTICGSLVSTTIGSLPAGVTSGLPFTCGWAGLT